MINTVTTHKASTSIRTSIQPFPIHHHLSPSPGAKQYSVLYVHWHASIGMRSVLRHSPGKCTHEDVCFSIVGILNAAAAGTRPLSKAPWGNKEPGTAAGDPMSSLMSAAVSVSFSSRAAASLCSSASCCTERRAPEDEHSGQGTKSGACLRAGIPDARTSNRARGSVSSWYALSCADEHKDIHATSRKPASTEHHRAPSSGASGPSRRPRAAA